MIDHSKATLEEKVGQLFMPTFSNYIMDSDTPNYKNIQKYSIGGIIYFGYLSKEVYCKLSKQLQQASKYPMLISIDQEGGQCVHLCKKNGYPATKSHQALGMLEPKESYKEAALMGDMLKECGININLAPVVDININPKNPIISNLERSFSSDPKIVVDCAAKFMEGLHEKGIFTCLKHFPGHGSSVHDTHVETADVTKLFKYEDELYPYKMLCGSTDLVMTSHVFNSNIDAEYPASMSKKTIDILRNDLHFDGVVITDAIYMKALSSHYTIDKICEQCLLAGNDIILINASIEDTIPFIENIIAKAKEDKVMLARIEESFKRVMALKSKVKIIE